jgi:hypothetical protein
MSLSAFIQWVLLGYGWILGAGHPLTASLFEPKSPRSSGFAQRSFGKRLLSN